MFAIILLSILGFAHGAVTTTYTAGKFTVSGGTVTLADVDTDANKNGMKDFIQGHAVTLLAESLTQTAGDNPTGDQFKIETTIDSVAAGSGANTVDVGFGITLKTAIPNTAFDTADQQQAGMNAEITNLLTNPTEMQEALRQQGGNLGQAVITKKGDLVTCTQGVDCATTTTAAPGGVATTTAAPGGGATTTAAPGAGTTTAAPGNPAPAPANEPASGGGLACFDFDTIVETQTGAKAIGDLTVGESVLDAEGDYSEVVGFIHRGKTEAYFKEVVTTHGSLRVSGSHVVDTNEGYFQVKDVTVGMELVMAEMNAEITEIRDYVAEGWVSPLTKSGTIVVDGFKASCYAHIYAKGHWLANLVMWPRRHLFNTAVIGTMGSYAYYQNAFWALTPLASLVQ